jgi:signal transduction histidine kinase/CheY-like chemotaxis protein
VAGTTVEYPFLVGGGETGALIRAYDWAGTALGDPASWPSSLRTALSLMLGSAAPVYVAWGPDLVSFYNDGYLPIVGTKHPGIGLPFATLWAEIWDEFRPIVAATLAGTAQHFVDQPVALAGRPDLPVGYFTFSYTPLRDDEGRIAGFYCTSTETTSNVLVEQRLRESETRLRFMNELDERLRGSADAGGAMRAAAEHLARHLHASRTAYADVDADNDRFIIRDDYTVPGLDSSAGTYSLDLFGPRAAADMRGGQTLVIRDIAAELALGEGREMFTAIGIRAIVCCPLIKDGRLVAMMAVHQDMPRDWRDTDIALVEAVVDRCWAHVQRVGAEARLRESHETLEMRVAERTAELLQAQEALRQSQKLESMGQLTGGVAHDFNNLLTPIIGSLDMLVRRGLGSERERRMIDGALQSAERARTLVQRLLAFARRQPLQPAAVDVRAVVETMAGLIDSTLGPTIAVRLRIADDLPPAWADANQLEMALLNLAVNARDAMETGGVLTIAAARESVRGPHPAALPRGHYLRISVADTGTGMDAETLSRAVEPFFSTKGIGRGTGLGLSMVHGLASQLGGGIAIESSPGEGTAVSLWLPLSILPIEADGDNPAALPDHDTRGRVLLVDDEAVVRMSTAGMLEDLGYEVEEVPSAEAALALLEGGTEVDLLVTDHLMPGISGADLARRVRASWPGLPILIVSGYAEEDGIAPDLPRLAKPFRAAELAASLDALRAVGY